MARPGWRWPCSSHTTCCSSILVLPGRDGLEILRQVRTVRPTQPVIILTARGAESDRVTGLQLGADDYVIKPFSIKELLARIEAVLRRSPERPRDIVQIPFPGGVADLARSEIRFDDGERVELSEKEVELLRYLAANAGRAISRDELLLRVWQISPRGWPRGRSTCTSRGCGKNFATIRPSRGSCSPSAARVICLQKRVR